MAISKSALLRERQTKNGGGKGIRSARATRQEAETTKATAAILAHLRRKYSDTQFVLETAIKVHEYRNNFESEKSFIKPDGGLIFAYRKDGTRILVLTTEIKQQGTNDLRLKEGKTKQAAGNAVERGAKNISEVNLLTLHLNQTGCPYLFFASGYDFREGSTIIDRLGSLTSGSDLNRVHGTRNVHNQFRATLFVRQKPWTFLEITNYGIALAEKVMTVDY